MNLIITTSREPSRRTRTLVNELRRVIPNTIKFNRGKATYKDLALLTKRYNSQGILIILEMKGNPSMLMYLVPMEGYNALMKRYLITLKSVKLLREMQGAQMPYNVKELLLNASKVPHGLPQEVGEVITEIFKPALTLSGNDPASSLELVITGCEDSAEVSFYCVLTGRPCGPLLTISKVVRVEESV